MTWWQALILGIVEGLTEYLPVSSTGHLILTAWLLGFGEDRATWDASFTFNIVIQAGAILAVFGLYWARVKQMTIGLAGAVGIGKGDDEGRRLAINLIIAFLPAAALGPLLNDRIEESLNGPWPVVGALFVGAWLMLAVAKSRTLSDLKQEGRDLDAVNWRIALLIGFAQCVAMWPGTSRSMMTIVAAMLLGFRAKAAAEFSFLLGLITLTAATGYSALKGGSEMIDQFGWTAIAVGLVASTVSAALAVKWFVGFLTKHGLAPFGWYRLALAAVIAGALWMGWVAIPEARDDAQPPAPLDAGSSIVEPGVSLGAAMLRPALRLPPVR